MKFWKTIKLSNDPGVRFEQVAQRATTLAKYSKTGSAPRLYRWIVFAIISRLYHHAERLPTKEYCLAHMPDKDNLGDRFAFMLASPSEVVLSIGEDRLRNELYARKRREAAIAREAREIARKAMVTK